MNEFTKLRAKAEHGTLPPNFNQWDIRRKDNLTLAHVAAFHHKLPANFTQWDLADNLGWTVAHIAAANGSLPSGFSQWGLSDKSGFTVRRMFEIHKETSVVKRYKLVLSLRDDEKLTYREIAARLGVSTSRVQQLYQKGVRVMKNESLSPHWSDEMDVSIRNGMATMTNKHAHETSKEEVVELLKSWRKIPGMGKLRMKILCKVVGLDAKFDTSGRILSYSNN